MNPVGAALGHGRDLQPARSSVFRLVSGGEHFHFRDRLDVHLEHLPVVAGVHRRDTVHHDVVLPAAPEARRRAGDAGGQLGQAGEVAGRERKVLDRRRGDGERALAARGLNEGGFGGHVNGFGCAAYFDHEGADRDAVATADGDARAFQRLESRHRDFDGVARGSGLGARDD